MSHKRATRSRPRPATSSPGGDDLPPVLASSVVHRVDAATQAFRHAFEGERRQLGLVQGTERTLRMTDVPRDWPDPATVILAPLMPDDIDVLAFVEAYPEAQIGLLGQGLQRAVLPGSDVIAHRAQPSSVLLDAARPNVTIVLSEEEIALWPAGALAHLVEGAARVVITRGARGATVHRREGTRQIAPAPATVVDATGAGDTFAAAFILGLRAGEQFAGRLAAVCAAAAVEVRGPAPLPSWPVIESRVAALPTVSTAASDGEAIS